MKALSHLKSRAKSALSISLTFIAALGMMFSLAQTAQAAGENGRNVNVVNFSGGGNGTFRQVSRNQWIEQNAQGQRKFAFRETHRDDWSVYLHDRSRNVRIQLDLHRKMVGYSDSNNPNTRDLYRISGVSSKLSGWLVRQVNFNNGAFISKGGRRWVETGSQNEVRFHFSEVARDDWSVYLKDNSRNVHIQLDLHTRKIMYNAGNDPRVPLYNITRAN